MGLFESDFDTVYFVLNLVMSAIGSFCSLITIVLIYRMQNTKGHVLLVLYMTWCQFFYDTTLFNSNVNTGYYYTNVANVFQLASGIGASLISNWIAFIAAYIIYNRRKFDVEKYRYHILFSSLTIGVIDAIVYAVATIPREKRSDHLVNVSILGYYYNLRLISITVNFFLCFLTTYLIQTMSSKNRKKSKQEIALQTLTRRMMYYPIIQATGRVGYAWYEIVYGASITTEDLTVSKAVALIIVTITTPLVSLGYLILFIHMQPNAYRHLVALFTCQNVSSIKIVDDEIKSRVRGSQKSYTTDEILDRYIDEGFDRDSIQPGPLQNPIASGQDQSAPPMVVDDSNQTDDNNLNKAATFTEPMELSGKGLGRNSRGSGILDWARPSSFFFNRSYIIRDTVRDSNLDNRDDEELWDIIATNKSYHHHNSPGDFQDDRSSEMSNASNSSNARSSEIQMKARTNSSIRSSLKGKRSSTVTTLNPILEEDSQRMHSSDSVISRSASTADQLPVLTHQLSADFLRAIIHNAGHSEVHDSASHNEIV